MEANRKHWFIITLSKMCHKLNLEILTTRPPILNETSGNLSLALLISELRLGGLQECPRLCECPQSQGRLGSIRDTLNVTMKTAAVLQFCKAMGKISYKYVCLRVRVQHLNINP